MADQDILKGLRLVGKLISTGGGPWPVGQSMFLEIPQLQIVTTFEHNEYGDPSFMWQTETKAHIVFEPLPFDNNGSLYRILEKPPAGYYPEHPFKPEG